MKKIIIITMAIGFLAGCSGPTDQQSQKEPTRHPVKAAKQYDPWPKHQKSTAEPMKDWPGAKTGEEQKKEVERLHKKTQQALKQFSEGKETE